MSQFHKRQETALINSAKKIIRSKLGISELRPGPSGNPDAPNAVNGDESKVSSYTLPDPLVFEDGSPVETPSDWQKRREEFFELFNREVYGRVP